MLSGNTDRFFNEIFQLFKEKLDFVRKGMEESRFIFQFLCRLNIRDEKVNVQRGLSFIKSHDWFTYENAIRNQKKIMMIDIFCILL